MPSERLVDEEAAPVLITRRKVPAWLLSLALHLAALLLGMLLVRSTYLPAAGDELSRPTSIVLAQTSAYASVQYFSDEDVASESAAHGPNDEQASALTATGSPLHSQPPTSGIELPGAFGPETNPELHVIRPSPQTGRGKYRMSGLTAADVASILAEDAARPRDAGPTGPTTKLSLFGSAGAEGRSFVFLIDRSQSMGHEGLGAIAAAAKELAGSIDALGPEHKFQVIVYNQKPLSLGGRELIQATRENKRKLIEFVASTVAYGATEHEMGLFAALQFKPEVVFLFTDGGDPALKAGQLRAIRDAAAGRTAIHCLHFGTGPLEDRENFLQRLADQNRGSYVYIDMVNE